MAAKETVKCKESNKHICSGCINEFDPKEIFIGRFPGQEYTTDYCEKCIDKLGIMEVVPYYKPRIKSAKTKTTTKKADTKTKAVSKKSTTKRNNKQI